MTCLHNLRIVFGAHRTNKGMRCPNRQPQGIFTVRRFIKTVIQRPLRRHIGADINQALLRGFGAMCGRCKTTHYSKGKTHYPLVFILHFSASGNFQ